MSAVDMVVVIGRLQTREVDQMKTSLLKQMVASISQVEIQVLVLRKVNISDSNLRREYPGSNNGMTGNR